MGDLFDRIDEYLSHSPRARLVAIACVALIAIGVAARIALARWTDERRARWDAGGGDAFAARTDPWLLAQSLAGAGRYADAARALYLAVLQRTALRTALRLHPSKTSGDYVRDLRRLGAPVSPAFAAFARRADHVIYGSIHCDAAEFEALLRAAEPLLASASPPQPVRPAAA
jgi:hypothetical protein